MSNELVAQHRATKHNDMIHQESTSQQKHNRNENKTQNIKIHQNIMSQKNKTSHHNHK